MTAPSDTRLPVDPSVDPTPLRGSGLLFLDRPGVGWALVSGEVDLFVVPTDDEGRPGRRHYVGSAGPGALLLGAPPVVLHGRTWRLAAVGVAAQAHALAPDWLESLRHSEELAAGVHMWLTTTLAGLDALGRRRGLVAGGSGDAVQISVAPGDVLNAPEALVWVVSHDAVLAVGERAREDAGPTPLGAAFGTTVLRAGMVSVRPTGELTTEEVAAGLAWVQRAMMQAHATQAAETWQERVRRRGDRWRLDAEARQDALSLLQRVGDRSQWVAVRGDEPLLAAFRVLGHHLGVDVNGPPTWAAGVQPDPVRAIARASRVRVRPVALRGSWWRDAGDPLLAFRAADGRPVALVPAPWGGYRATDPITRRSERVTRSTADTLRQDAYLVYPPLPNGRLTLGRLLRFSIEGGRADALRTLLYSVLVGALSIAIPLGFGTILGRLVPEGREGPVLSLAVLLLMVGLAITAVGLARSAAFLRLQGRMLARMQAALWDRVLALPPSFFGRYPVAEVSQRLGGVEAIRDTVSTTASETLLAVVILVFSTGLLFTYDPLLALTVVATLAVVLGLGAVCSLGEISVLRTAYAAKTQMSSTLLQMVQGNEKLHAAAAEERALTTWARTYARHSDPLLTSWQWGAARTALYAMLPPVLTLVVFGSVLAEPGRLSTTAFLTFIAALAQVAGATGRLDAGISSAILVSAIFKGLDPFLDEAPEGGPQSADPGLLQGRVALSGVTFAYQEVDRPVLEDVDLTIEPGEFVALVGRSGSGKSTVVRLLLGFERPDEGTVTYDGKDLATLDVRAVRDQLGVALQDGDLAGTDILSVIAGDRPLSEEQAMAAAERVGLADEIRALPLGLHTRLGDAGEMLSGGQAQRVLLAAALARNPRIVILDEATSALDSLSQTIVTDSFGSLQVTRIVVAHRLSTLRHAQRVVVLDRGRIVQDGTVAELSAQEGLFAEMVRRQVL